MIRQSAYRLLGLLPDWLLRIFPVEKLVKFCIIGGVGAVFGMGLLYTLTEWGGLHYLLSLAIVYLPMSYLVYMGNCGWTFKSFKGTKGFAKFLLAKGVTTLAGFGVVALLTSVFNIWYMASPVLAGGSMALVNFLISKNWIWKRRENLAENCKTPSKGLDKN